MKKERNSLVTGRKICAGPLGFGLWFEKGPCRLPVSALPAMIIRKAKGSGKKKKKKEGEEKMVSRWVFAVESTRDRGRIREDACGIIPRSFFPSPFLWLCCSCLRNAQEDQTTEEFFSFTAGWRSRLLLGQGSSREATLLSQLKRDGNTKKRKKNEKQGRAREHVWESSGRIRGILQSALVSIFQKREKVHSQELFVFSSRNI